MTGIITKIHVFSDVEGAEIDCPDCGGSAIYNDGGVCCPNDSCPSNN